MNAMDYEKKYNDALNLAKSYYGNGCNDFLDTIFPELRESEDERMLRELIRGFEAWKGHGNMKFNNIFVGDILAFLEKQKEQKPVQLEEEKEYIRTLKSRIADFLRGKDKDEVDTTYYQRICDWLDGRHVEQKPVEIHIDNPNIHKVDPDVKITTSDSSAGGDELLYVSNKSYNIGYRDGVASVKPSEEQMEVDLEKEMEKVGANWPFPASFDGYAKEWVDGLMEECAKHFYELGLKAKEDKQ